MSNLKVILLFVFSLALTVTKAEDFQSLLKQSENTYNYHYYEDDNKSFWIDGLSFSSENRKFPDLKFYSLENDKELSSGDLFKSNKAIVIEYGNITCPSFLSKQKKMTELMHTYKDIADFYILYIRENHPGETFPEHKSFQQKINHAKMLKEFDHVESKILIDDLKGSAHQALGNYPNSVFVVGADKIIAYRGIFNSPNDVENTLKKLALSLGMATKIDYIQKYNGIKKEERDPTLKLWYKVILSRSKEFIKGQKK